MFRHCIFCSAPLGENEALETFPVGRRLAFDPGKGRLWVVCRQCERWNLSPLETRWEAIEGAERLFRDTPTRTSTENIGLARVADGTDLIRIGRPQRPEFAAWRYGDQFGRRRNRALVGLGVAVGVGGGLVVGSAALAGLSAAFLPLHLFNVAQQAWRYRGGTATTIRDERGRLIPIPYPALGAQKVRPSDDHPGGWVLELGATPSASRFLSGPAAVEALGQIMPRVNRLGGGRKVVRAAVQGIEDAGGPHAFFRDVERRARRVGRGYSTILQLPVELRLALEMSAHEDHERAALEGELERLERQWREAEEIAAIADDLLLPAGLRSTLDRLRDRSRTERA